MGMTKLRELERVVCIVLLSRRGNFAYYVHLTTGLPSYRIGKLVIVENYVAYVATTICCYWLDFIPTVGNGGGRGYLVFTWLGSQNIVVLMMSF